MNKGISSFLTAFRNKRIINTLLAASMILHFLAGALMITISQESPLAVSVVIIASISLAAIVILSENFKQAIIYPIIATAPVPIFLFLMLLVTVIAFELKGGFADLTTKHFVIVFWPPLLVQTMLLGITWPYLLGAYFVKLLIVLLQRKQ